MSRKYLDRIATLVPLGVVGASLLLGSGATAAAATRPVVQAPVSERLSAIREAVLDVVGPADLSDQVHRNFHLAWGNRWNNWGWRGRPGWRRPPWNNWRNGWPNWNNFWRNW